MRGNAVEDCGSDSSKGVDVLSAVGAVGAVQGAMSSRKALWEVEELPRTEEPRRSLELRDAFSSRWSIMESRPSDGVRMG